MAVYPHEALKKQSTGDKVKKPNPAHGEHEMKIVWEGPSKTNQTQHSFRLENETAGCWYNVFVTDLLSFAEKCGVKPGEFGLDTSTLKGKSLKVNFGEGYSKAGKKFEGVLKVDGLIPDVNAPLTADMEIPF